MFGKMVVLSILGPVLILAQSLKNDENSTDIRSVSLERIIVVANKMPTQNAKFAGQVGVLNENDLVKSPSIIENLGQIPGIQTGADYGRQAGQSYNIRGTGYGSDTSESRVIVEQDGIARSPSMFNGQVSSFRVDNDLLKRVEVVKGGSSVLYGSGAIGGVVSMRTKSVDDFILGGKSYGVMVGHRQESNHMNSNRGALAFKPAENLGILLYAKHADFGDIKLADGGRNGVSKVQNDERINTALGKV
ncbi:TonB-dependent receptor plug domain-containing protein [Campylobacter sp. FOBRC14]|uniref:TonB-dependent receptor plug domain-containing protein n=2 Tax=Campylobacter TaxID=194 RepID=UPI00027A367D|nr:TonB-dependent receptor plug domain-containing protein [Campylobacter sp. FOBRC14]EJP75499.1 TonB-dependent receptor plug domain protein [Campylobacter sp. FOBRC14]